VAFTVSQPARASNIADEIEVLEASGDLKSSSLIEYSPILASSTGYGRSADFDSSAIVKVRSEFTKNCPFVPTQAVTVSTMVDPLPPTTLTAAFSETADQFGPSQSPVQTAKLSDSAGPSDSIAFLVS
jgi:hypothetical protein